MLSSWRSRLLIALAAAVVGIGVAVLLRQSAADEPVALPTVTPTPSPTPTPPPQPEPFEVRIVQARGQPLDHGNVYGRKPRQRPKAVDRATRRAVQVLTTYLDAAFVEPETRFTDAALQGLLTKRAAESLSAGDRRALGVGAPDIVGGRTRPVRIRSRVAHNAGNVLGVTLSYRVRMQLELTDGSSQPLRQDGTMLFVRTPRGLRVDMLDVRLVHPDPPEDTQATPSPTPTGSPTPTPGGTS